MLKKVLTGLAVSFAIGSSGAHALTVPYTESFDDGLSGWTTGSNPNAVFTSGGVDDGAYLSTVANVTPGGFGAQVLFRCESTACSDGAFQGDWRGTVGTLSWYFRHNADIALQAYARVVGAASNALGASGIVTTLVQPNEWTRVDLEIFADNPEFTSFSSSSFEGIFGDVGRVQLGISVPAGFTATGLSFDIDQVSLAAPVPLPAAAWLFAPAVAGLGLMRRRLG